MNCRANPTPEIAFYPMEANGANYPKAIIPLLAPASLGNWFGRKYVSEGSAFLQGGEPFVHGRYALAEAMRRAGVGAGKAVLLPAFHCRAIVEPVLYLGAQPCFYPVTADLRPDFSALSSLLSENGIPVVAMVITHYFGFQNDIDEAERFCVQHGIALIEDCAHALYGQIDGRLLGTVGSYATASLWKFLPVREGALLRDNTGEQPMPRLVQPVLAEAKELAAIAEVWSQRILHSQHFPGINASLIREQARIVADQAKMCADEPGFKEFLPDRAGMSSLRLSQWVLAHAAHGRCADRRRANYSRWLEGVRSIPGVEPLFPDLPEGVVPYAFPLLVDAAGLGFHLLKMAGIPLWRWEDMAVTDCSISRDYRIRVLQLPCHQELSEGELDWMILAAQTLLSGIS